MIIVYVAAGALLGLLQLGLGILLGLWIRRSGHPAREGQVDEERARELLTHLRTLARGLTQDVQGHQNQISQLNDQLIAVRQTKQASLTDLVVGVVGEVLRANEQLQQKLNLAETQLQQQSEAIASHLSQALTDELTGLPNRRAFDDQLRRHLKSHAAHNIPFSIMLIDVDYFKLVNDTHGHVAGDRVLSSIAEVLRSAMRKPDVVARYGGEEFAALLPGTTLKDAVFAARHARLAVEAATTHFDGIPIRVTASLGIAAVQHGDDFIAIIRRADEALYASKSNGRNCCHLHDGTACTRIVCELADAESRALVAQVIANEEEAERPAWAATGLTPELASACAGLRGCADIREEPAPIL